MSLLRPRPITLASIASVVALLLSNTDLTSYLKSLLPQSGEATPPAAPAAGGPLGYPGSSSRCPQFFPQKSVLPRIDLSPQRRLRELCFDAFAVIHSGQSRTPVLVIERLTRRQLQDARGEERTNRFYPEARLPSADRATPDDYRNSGFDRGHMAPAADMPTAQAMAQSFSMANMVPQAQQNNRGPWADIEQATRKYVMRSKGAVQVYTGPMFPKRPRTIGDNQVWVPSQLYKLVYDETENRAWAYWIDNRDDASFPRPISYAELVKRTGIEFLPGLNPGH